MIYDGFENLNVKLVEATPHPFKTFWNWYRMTWEELHSVDFDFNNTKVKEACLDVLNFRALPTPMEAIQIQFEVKGLSRVGLAQITRGRVGWGFNVLSQMPRPIQHRVTMPLNIVQDDRFNERAKKLIEDSQNLYDDMHNAGIPPQDCRYLAIHGQQTDLVILTNFIALKGFFARRCENGLTDELNLVGRLLKRELVKFARKQPADSGWYLLLEKLDAMGADKKVCLNNDKVFGNTGRFKSTGNFVPEPDGEIEPDYDFTKSAWYLELQKLPDDLLFDGEKEMIKRWKSNGDLCG